MFGKSIRLPAPFALPGDLGAIGRLIGALASRAGAIQAAFVRSVRRAAVLPSAFVGRYDPAKAPDPWDELIANSARARPSERIKASQDGKSLAERSGDLAQAAARRHARHIRALRASRENPSAFAGRYDPAAALIEIEEMSPASLARSAAERMAEHVRRQRLARPMPSVAMSGGRSVPQ